MNTRQTPPPDHLAFERKVSARTQDDTLASPEPLSHYSDVQAWVLIADPGAGKTDVFETLKTSESGYYVKARDFVELDLPNDWSPPLFIDGLDEYTASTSEGQTAIGRIRSKLQALGTPKFRISCREADWRSNTDSNALKQLVGASSFSELHLVPLDRTQTAALVAHWQKSSQAAAEKFIREAENRGLEGLLDNPQTLRMLVEAVAVTANDWPDSKVQTYEMACAQLIREPNEDHLAAQRSKPLPRNKVLQAAGYLSAIMLLSGSTAIALQRRSALQLGIVELPELVSSAAAPDLQFCQAALETRLFRGDGLGDFWPVHRTVAEYLGAQYLASRIQARLPANRVLALMLGEDSGVVPELRGLHAWLAAVAPEDLRRELVDRDPLGLVLNGDVRHFSRAEKLHLLNALRDEATQYTYFRSQNWASHPFGALATTDMVEDFRAWFQSPDRSPPHLAIVDCLLDALANGHPMPGLAPELEQVVRDKSYWPGSRKEVLGILVTYAHEENNWATLTQLLEDIHSNVVEDLEDELLGTLLQYLYPGHISPAELWRYFRKPKSDRLIGAYWRFWKKMAQKIAPSEDIPVLLDALLSTGFRLTHEQDRRDASKTVGELLARGVIQHGGQIEVDRLLAWLSLGLGPHAFNNLQAEHKAQIGQWLSEHPAIYKALFEHGLALLSNTSGHRLWQLRAQLCEAKEPDDAVLWYMSLAKECSDDDLRRQLISDAFYLSKEKDGPDAAITLAEQWSSDHFNDAVWVTTYFLSVPYPPDEAEQEHRAHESKYKEQAAEEHRKKIRFFSETLPAFVGGTAHLGALMEVANAYLNYFHNSNEGTPAARLLELLNNDAEWVQLALAGLRQCLFRDDLPSAKEIVDAYIKGQRYNVAVPCLAAMELRYTEDPLSALDLPQPVLEAMVAFRLSHDFDNTPIWFKQLLLQQPGILAQVMQQLIGKQITSKKEHADGLYALAHDTDYAIVATQIVPLLITDFPLKASKNQLQNLRLLIIAMLARLDDQTQRSLIASKLASEAMDVAQRVYWLTAGIQVAADIYLEPAKQFIGKIQARASHVFDLVHTQHQEDRLRFQLPATVQAFFIGLFGPTCSPPWAKRSVNAVWVTPQMEMGRYVEGLISALAGNPDDTAVQALATLQQRQDLKQWADYVSRALYDQRVTRRKALFKPASVAKVCDTLAGLKPANAADLWALTVDHLQQLADEIRNGSTNDYRQYWANKNPKLEDDCRDALLSDLKKHFAYLGIAAEREGHYADAKRADIKVIAGPLHMPIEIKREMHPDLWKAIREQLVAKYSRESASEGYGIYLVFWFTGNFKAAPTDGGSRPKTPQELQQRLAATVPETLRHKIAVLVVDCSKPQATQVTKKIT